MTLTKVIAGMADDSVFEANKNVIINGNFDIWQRGTTFTSVTSADYTADRWQWSESGAGVVDILRSTSVSDATSDFSLQVDVTTLDTIEAGDFYYLVYKVEGFDAMRFAFGDSTAISLTLSFWVKSPKTGIHCVAFRNSAFDRNYIVEYTVDVADTWEYKTITLTADAAGTWLTNDGIGLRITWALAMGSTFHGSADTWQAGNLLATSNQVNVMDSTANNFHLSQVQLEVGSTATSFERRSFATELSMCQRYYQQYVMTASQTVIVARGTGGNGFWARHLQDTMRATPSTALSNTSNWEVFTGSWISTTPSFSAIDNSAVVITFSTGGINDTLLRNTVGSTLTVDAEL